MQIQQLQHYQGLWYVPAGTLKAFLQCKSKATSGKENVRKCLIKSRSNSEVDHRECIWQKVERSKLMHWLVQSGTVCVFRAAVISCLVLYHTLAGALTAWCIHFYTPSWMLFKLCVLPLLLCSFSKGSYCRLFSCWIWSFLLSPQGTAFT